MLLHYLFSLLLFLFFLLLFFLLPDSFSSLSNLDCGWGKDLQPNILFSQQIKSLSLLLLLLLYH